MSGSSLEWQMREDGALENCRGGVVVVVVVVMVVVEEDESAGVRAATDGRVSGPSGLVEIAIQRECVATSVLRTEACREDGWRWKWEGAREEWRGRRRQKR